MSKIKIKLPIQTTMQELLDGIRESGFAARRWTPAEADAVAELMNEFHAYITNKRHHRAWDRNHIATQFEWHPFEVLDSLDDAVGEDDESHEFWNQKVSDRLRKIAARIDKAIAANPSPPSPPPAKVTR